MNEGKHTVADAPEMAAAVDLGSNSFHMIVARTQHGQMQPVDRVRERVQLAEGLDAKRRLSQGAQKRALRCLERFGERLEGIPSHRVRAVGTNTLRQARNGREFLEVAYEALGHPIEIISGLEEARLIYLGVAHSLADDEGRRLVIDIGGGSTELIIGERFEPQHRDSMYMGCVSFTKTFFGDGQLSADAFAKAELAARRELQSIGERYKKIGWQQSIGASGTINSVDQILRLNDWSSSGITLKGLRKLSRALQAQGEIAALAIDGLEPDRAQVIAGGVAILSAIFESLGIERMTASSGALREGVLYDLIGRIDHEDVRDQTIQRLCSTYHVDLQHAARVRDIALGLLDQVGLGWGVDGLAARGFLSWAAQLHEIGLSISHTGFHKHGAYIVTHADMPGFSRDDQLLLAALIRNHRRKLRAEDFRGISTMRAKVALRLCVLLRLSDVLNRSRNPEALPQVSLAVRKDRFKLSFPGDWLTSHPLTRADLDEEMQRMSDTGLELAVC